MDVVDEAASLCGLMVKWRGMDSRTCSISGSVVFPADRVTTGSKKITAAETRLGGGMEEEKSTSAAVLVKYLGGCSKVTTAGKRQKRDVLLGEGRRLGQQNRAR